MELTEGTVYLGLKNIRYPTAGDPERYHWFIQLRVMGRAAPACMRPAAVSLCKLPHKNMANSRTTSSAGAFQFEAKPSSSKAVSAIISIARLNGRNLNTLTESL